MQNENEKSNIIAHKLKIIACMYAKYNVHGAHFNFVINYNLS